MSGAGGSPAEPQRDPLHGGRRAGVVALVVLLAIAYATLDGGRSRGPGGRGLAPGAQLPPFAVPLATAAIDCDDAGDACDANVATRAGQGGAGRRPACDVRGATILNVCELAERGPVVLAFFATGGGDCAEALDPLKRVAERHPGVRVAVVGIRGDLGDLRAVARGHGWRFSVGWDRDGILASLYGVAVCPHVTYASWRGRVQSTTVGPIGVPGLGRRIDAALAASQRAGWRAPEGRARGA